MQPARDVILSRRPLPVQRRDDHVDPLRVPSLHRLVGRAEQRAEAALGEAVAFGDDEISARAPTMRQGT
jgi:hypothetical protein